MNVSKALAKHWPLVKLETSVMFMQCFQHGPHCLQFSLLPAGSAGEFRQSKSFLLAVQVKRISATWSLFSFFILSNLSNTRIFSERHGHRK